MEKSTTVVGLGKVSGIAGNPECVGVGTLVGGVQYWLVCTKCVCV